MVGQPHFQIKEPPRFTVRQNRARTESEQAKMKEKVNKVRKRRYIESGPVKSLTHMFSVPKGMSDIRMVYNGTSCGLNDTLWAPHFSLPEWSRTRCGVFSLVTPSVTWTWERCS